MQGVDAAAQLGYGGIKLNYNNLFCQNIQPSATLTCLGTVYLTLISV